MRPAKTQFSRGIRPVRLESLLWRFMGTKTPNFLQADSEDADDTGQMPRLICLRWAHGPFYWFCHAAAHLCSRIGRHLASTEQISQCLPQNANRRSWLLTRQINYKMSPVKRICVFEHSVMTNFNCACPAIQRGQGSGFLSESSS